MTGDDSLSKSCQRKKNSHHRKFGFVFSMAKTDMLYIEAADNTYIIYYDVYTLYVQ